MAFDGLWQCGELGLDSFLMQPGRENIQAAGENKSETIDPEPGGSIKELKPGVGESPLEKN